MSQDKLINLITSDLALSLQEAEHNLDTNLKQGLDEDEAKGRLIENGPNLSIKSKKRSELYKFITNIIGIHNIPLWFAAILCVCVYFTEYYLIENDVKVKPDNFYVGLSLFAFVFAFGIFSYYMEAKCEYYVDSCREYVSHYSTVIRGGVLKEIFYQQLVVGDLIIFWHGDEICADIKLIECANVRINLNMLAPREKHYYTVLYGTPDRIFSPGDIILKSSFIYSGHGKAIVTRTRQHYLSSSGLDVQYPVLTKRQNLNPLTVELKKLSQNLSILAIIFSAFYALSSIFFAFNWLRAVMFWIALYVGIITEALLPTFKVAKAQMAKELASRNCYIQNIEALETLGTTTIICTNKTGVITQNRMIVSKIWIDNQLMDSYEFMRDYQNSDLQEPFKSFVRACSLCIFAHFSDDEDPKVSPFKRNAIGKPSEVALLRFMEAFIGNLEDYQANFHRLLELSFNGQNKCSFKVYAHAEQKKRHQMMLCVKSQPETLIYSANLILTGDGLKRFSQSHKSHLLALCNKLGKAKFRLIAIAQIFIEHKDKFQKRNGQLDIAKFERILERDDLSIQFLGLIVLQNPIRMSTPEAIFQCRRAGIKVLMITGDHPATALSIAETAGIANHKQSLPSNIYTSDDLINMKDNHLRSIISSKCNLVFARISPEDKLRIINCCRQFRSIVAAIGVGTFDLAILDRSHVRVSLGRYGSDITKTVSDIILLDDNFSSIVHGIEAGRVLFENIKKSLCYTLSSKPVELMPYLFYITLSIPLMASSFTILAIDLFTDNLPAIALGYERAEAHVMKGYPRHIRKEKVIDCQTIIISLFFYGVIQLMSGSFAYIVVMSENGFCIRELLFIRKRWYSMAINDIEDSYGQEWTYQQRSELEYLVHTTYFITIVITRTAVLIACRTRRDSSLTKLFSNVMVNFSIFFQLFLTVFMAYYSPFQYTIRMYPLKLFWWLLNIPFFVLLIVLEEIRKWFIRTYPYHHISQLIYY